ncbi:biotin--[acetyl-CoA-carboxylase] ligase [Mangrovibacillus cuniculi]|uniref:Bifunctional ligase/repressor BirA n=2 Tax=Mangrovibacillus cuniculi TaxID=2593652 RepID=A0A7S8CE99_9BACI|nr:biotin--[acetyl-CoA-carboxylase] ligase [Mangrovibacillus cuniculi]
MFSSMGNEYISGQQIAQELGCSRQAIWKAMDELRQDGFEIEAIRRKGYRLIGNSDQFSKSELLYQLNTSHIGQVIELYESVSSTQIIAHEKAKDGAKHGTVIMAEEQTSGRGRMTRQWSSPKNTGIWMSTILRPTIHPQEAPPITLVVAVAIAQSIEELTGIIPTIKWPNDILVGSKKIAGILTELQSEMDVIHYMIIGTGINVNTEEFPEELKSIASSLLIETGEKQSRVKLAQLIWEKVEKLLDIYEKHGFAPIKLLWESYVQSIGQEIQARTLQGTYQGIMRGITDKGVLELELSNGRIVPIYSADIEIL